MFHFWERTVSASAWIVLLVFVLMLCGLLRLARPRKISDEDFEREARRPSLLGTGLLGTAGLPRTGEACLGSGHPPGEAENQPQKVRGPAGNRSGR
jgi:hypothetical protein